MNANKKVARSVGFATPEHSVCLGKTPFLLFAPRGQLANFLANQRTLLYSKWEAVTLPQFWQRKYAGGGSLPGSIGYTPTGLPRRFRNARHERSPAHLFPA